MLSSHALSNRRLALHAASEMVRAGVRLATGVLGFMVASVLALGLTLIAPSAQATAPPAGTTIHSVARLDYIPDGYRQSETVYSNEVQIVILAVEALTLTQSQSVIRPPNVGVTLSHLLTNTGNTPSSYTVNWANGGPGCSADTLDLSSLRLVRDSNNNGVVDLDEPAIALNKPGAITLEPGVAVALLVQGTTPNMLAAPLIGSACLTLSATTALQTLSAVNNDLVALGNNAVLTLTKSGSYPGQIVPGTSDIIFTVLGNSIGAQDAKPVATAGPAAASILVDGSPRTLLLLRDMVPVGTRYNEGSLTSSAMGAIKLFRLASDPLYNYRSADPGPAAVEVAIGLPGGVARNASVAFSFSVRVNAETSNRVINTAQGFLFDGIGPVQTDSNTVVINLTPTRLGLAKRASAPQLNFNGQGVADGTASVHFTLRLKNYGSSALYDVQIDDLLEGGGLTQFGSYTAQTVPAAGQYTVVADSLGVAPSTGGVLGVAAVNRAFTGQAFARGVLAAGASLPVGAEFSVGFDVRFNLTGRSITLLNSARASAALGVGLPVAVTDDSTDGSDPDPDGDGNPGNNSVPTPVPVQLPALSLVKLASLTRIVDDGVFEVDYSFKVRNIGNGPALNVRVIDNLNCTFDMDMPGSPYAAWELVGRPITTGPLVSAPSFTGRAACDRAGLAKAQTASGVSASVPTEVALSLTDGAHALAPGQSDTVNLTLRVTLKPAFIGTRLVFNNTAWAAAFYVNAVDSRGGLTAVAISNANAPVTVAVVDNAAAVVSEPMGVVYNALTRAPVAGAVVSFTRTACQASAVKPITADQLYGATGTTGSASTNPYTFNADGSVSMSTGVDGVYQFQLKVLPAADLCTYTIRVSPPVGSGYLAPSALLAPTAGTFASCGPVAPNAQAPQTGQANSSTTYYFSVRSGPNANGGFCSVTHNHIPLDPGSLTGLVLKKEGSKAQAEFGDFLDYALTLTNKTGFPITGVTLNDTLPLGVAYIAGSSRLNGALVANPVGGSGPALSWSFPSLALAPDAAVVLRLRVRIGVGAPTEGQIINRARANAGPLQSNPASFTTRISGGVFADDAFIFGKVYLDCPRDGARTNGATAVAGTAREDAALGIPGVRLYLENGTFVVTDGEGKWSLYGVKPITHVLRVDQTTLPVGARLGVLDNRNAQAPESRFVDLKKGEFHKANFIVTNCGQGAEGQPASAAEIAEAEGVREEIRLRRAALARAEGEGATSGAGTGIGMTDEMAAQVRTRIDAAGLPLVRSDVRGLPASGQSSANGGTAMATALAPSTAPLIALPVAAASASTFVSGTSGKLSGTLGNASGNAAIPSGSLFAPLTGMSSGTQTPGITAATGTPLGIGTLGTSRLSTSTAPLSTNNLPMLPPVVMPLIDLEVLMHTLDNALSFIDLKDGDTVPAQAINVRVKGEQGVQLRLTVNAQEIDLKRVGKKAQLGSKQLVAWEYIGVQLKPGVNELQLDAVDDMGNVRNPAASPQGVRLRLIAPDKLGLILIDVPEGARADLRTPVVVKVRLTDAAGVPVTARTQLTLEADRGRWLDEDLDPGQPGLQAFMEGGSAEFKLMPPGEPGDVRIRVTAANFIKEVRVALLPEMRPMIGVGIVEGVLDFTKRGKLPLGAMPAGAAFEAELNGMTSVNGAQDKRASARAAAFFKGTVKGDFLLTAAYDSDKTRGDILFRDIQPDRYYPVYGDSAVKGYDAQSTQKLYVRIDKNRSYLLYGDFTTASSTEVRQLSQTTRSLTGMKDVYEDDRIRATTYASRTAQTQLTEEFRAVGTSGPFYLAANGDLVANSEQISILVRDRNNPNLVLQTTPVTRFVDYTIEPLTRRILFTHAISSWDTNLNPQSIRVTYESDAGGPKFVVAGTDVQVKVLDNLQLGVVASTDQNPQNRRRLAALTGIARMGEFTSMAAEIVRTETDLAGTGNAGRIEMRHQADRLAFVALASKTDASFDNPGASAAAGRTEASARTEFKVDETTALRGEAVYSKNDIQAEERRGASVSLQKKITDTVVGEVGYRHGQTNAGAISGFDYGQVSTYNGAQGGNVGAGSVGSLGANAAAGSNANDTLNTVRGRLSAQVPGVAQAQVFVEGEQDINHSDRHVLALGGNYTITEKTRLYGRYEAISTLNGPFDLGSTAANNTGILGIESTYMEGGRVYNEYRIADSIDGRAAQAAFGVRNTLKLTDTLRLTAGVEHTRNLSGYSNSKNNGTGNGTSGTNAALGQSTAVIGGVEYLTERLKGSLVAEARNGSDANTRLLSAGAGYKLDNDWSLLARSIVSDSSGQGSSQGNDRRLMRTQIGAAYRPVDTDVWNALMRYEHKSERIGGAGNAAGAIGTSAFGNSASSNAVLPGSYSTDIVSTHLNVNPARGNYLTARYAGKIARANDGNLKSSYWAHLVQARYTRDLGPSWDLGVQGGLLYGQGGALQKTLGFEIGYQVMKNLWASAGYNFIGLSDKDLTANEYTSKGLYMRLRYKFDETDLGFAQPEPLATLRLPVVAAKGSGTGGAGSPTAQPAGSEAMAPQAMEQKQ